VTCSPTSIYIRLVVTPFRKNATWKSAASPLTAFVEFFVSIDFQLSTLKDKGNKCTKKRKDDSNVATSMNYGVASSLSWSNSM
jgi:hypothetical protein